METNSLSVKEIRCKYQHNKFYDGYLVDHFCQIFSPYFTWLFVLSVSVFKRHKM